MEDATSIESEEIMLVVKKSDPNFPSWRLNLLLKKYVTHDLDSVLAIEMFGLKGVGVRTAAQGPTQKHPKRTKCTG